jgi:hypothetical protein
MTVFGGGGNGGGGGAILGTGAPHIGQTSRLYPIDLPQYWHFGESSFPIAIFPPSR